MGTFSSDGKTDITELILRQLGDQQNQGDHHKVVVAITDGGHSVSWNQGDLFVAVLIRQYRPDPRSKLLTEVWFVNNCIDSAYFSDCLNRAFAGDVDVSVVNEVQGEAIFLTSDEFAGDEGIEFLKMKSQTLLDILSQHPLWGFEGGPNKMVGYGNLE